MTIHIIDDKTTNIIKTFYEMTSDPFSGVDVINMSFGQFYPKSVKELINTYGEGIARDMIDERNLHIKMYHNQSLRIIKKDVFINIYDRKKKIIIEYRIKKQEI